ncbi:417L [Invertebrate iridescent virus Kaz2018]|uniref:417L n=1 Tax=Invertebrate iridescent virus 6 TaxID=176652 RepID=Q91FA8_IIV6|nr:417L [Invertebrate iridescent virus 6]AAK82277.1 417L [Invertebrate iridescent virus 6]QMS79517.1 hypothetical protein IIV6-T1_410 [Invertebrate iridescent virus 6]QNH08827.1 417L [Invertebrate iridescent virus Kaz2018]
MPYSLGTTLNAHNGILLKGPGCVALNLRSPGRSSISSGPIPYPARGHPFKLTGAL